MNRQERARLGRMTLDFRFEHGGLEALAIRPTRGWIRAIRDGLGMSSRQLAARLGVSQPAVAQLERSEANDRIQLDTLQRVADALHCDLVYALVPRTSLEQTVRDRAEDVARTEIASLESISERDGLGDTAQRRHQQIDHYAGQLIATGRLWDDPS